MNFFGRLLISYSVVALLSSLQVKAQNSPTTKEECVNRLVESCNKADYSYYRVGSSVLSSSENTPSGQVVHIFCLSDVNGTSCFLNHSPWYSCSPDHSATYKGTLLSANSTDGIDDDICYTADRLANGIFSTSNADVQAILEKNKKQLNRQMTNLRERLNRMNERLHKKISGCFPFCENNPFGPGFPFNN